MNKSALINEIVAHLEGELEVCFRAAKAAHSAVTDDCSKAESKIDARGLEASFLAQGQSKQAAELQAAIVDFKNLEPRTFSNSDPIGIGAYVELETRGERMSYFLGPRAGGTEVQHEDQEVLVITPQSPLGAQLQGKKQGDHLNLAVAGSRDEYRVVGVE